MSFLYNRDHSPLLRTRRPLQLLQMVQPLNGICKPVHDRDRGLIVKNWSRWRTKFASPIIALPGVCGRTTREAAVPVAMFAPLVYPANTRSPHVLRLRKLKARNDIRLRFQNRNTMSAFMTPYRCPTL